MRSPKIKTVKDIVVRSVTTGYDIFTVKQCFFPSYESIEIFIFSTLKFRCTSVLDLLYFYYLTKRYKYNMDTNLLVFKVVKYHFFLLFFQMVLLYT